MQESDILKKCLELGEMAYDQEVNRQKAIGSKADYLMKYHTLLIAILNLSLPLILNYADLKDTGAWRLFYLLTMGCLLSGIIFTLMIQKPRKVSMFQTGTMVMKEMQKRGKMINSEEWIYNNILQIDKATYLLEKSNNAAIKWIIASYAGFILSILLMGIFFYSVIW